MTRADHVPLLPPKANRLLAALPQADYERLLPHLKPVLLPVGEVLYEVGDCIHTIYFLTDGLVSKTLTSKRGGDVEVGIINRCGLIDTRAILLHGPAIDRALVQVKGSAYRISTESFKKELNRSSALRDLLLRHTQMMITQTAQSALCNRLHSIGERLCRWLLTVSDRIEADAFDLTQEFIANMVGARRTGVSETCGVLRKAGFIDYSRGHIQIIDRAGMEENTCECYSVIRDEFARLFD
jgi:CRP-like cAMP-binding protein